MKKLFILSFLFLLFSQIVFAVEKDNGYKIEKFVYKAQVDRGNIWRVTETITVNFLEPRHGIFQYVESRFDIGLEDSIGEIQKYVYQTTVKHFRAPYEYTAEWMDGSAHVLRIGDEHCTVTGRKTYIIEYTIQYPYDRYKEHDFMYHSILGCSWTTDIDTFTYDILFDEKLSADFSSNLQIYSGQNGSRSNDLSVSSRFVLDKNMFNMHLQGEATNIAYGNGITLFAYLPNGYWGIKAPRVDNTPRIVFYLTASVFAVLLVVLLFCWRRKPNIVIEYEAPDGIPSAEVGCIIDNSADISDLASLIVWWASKGYLKIKDGKNQSLKIIKLKDLPADAPAYQKTFWNVFFSSSYTERFISEIDNKYLDIRRALAELNNMFTESRQLSSWRPIPYFLLLTFVVFGSITIGLSSVVSTWEYLGTGVLWGGVMLFCYTMLVCLTKMDENSSGLLVGFFHLVAVAVSIYVAYSMHGLAESNYLLPSLYRLAIPIGGCILLPLVSGIIYDPPYRRQMMSRLLGFREFIRSSELPMLRAMVDENPSLFFDILPYAMVFNLTDKWKIQFKDIEMPPPSWYEIYYPDDSSEALDIDFVIRSVNNVITRQIEHISIDPSSSSSDGSDSSYGGGGGSCGGGGGGGGGGSW